MQEKYNPITVLLCAFGISSLAGLAALLRAGSKVNGIAVFSAMLNSGLLGLTMALLWYQKYQENTYFLIGLCILAGLGGATAVDFVVTVFKTGALRTMLQKILEVRADKK